VSLKIRITKIENRVGCSQVPSESDFHDALKLKHRHFRALVWPHIYEFAEPVDPEEIALMRIAEESGQIAAAREVEIRYWRARGVDIEARERKYREDALEALTAAFGEPASSE
jgi:hypothetical protein